METTKPQLLAHELLTIVRTGDYERFLAIQLAPAAQRPALYAVTALSVELSKVAETVSEPMIGQIRLAWWREGLEEIVAGKMPRAHPVLQALHSTYAAYHDIFPDLHRMVEARAADLDESMLLAQTGWENYLDGTAGALHRVWARVLGEQDLARVSLEARAYARVGMVRAIPYYAQQGFMRFPESIQQHYALENLAPSPAICAASRALLDEAKSMFHQSDSSVALVRPLRALKQFSLAHLSDLEKLNYDPYQLRQKPLRLLTQLVFLMLF